MQFFNNVHIKMHIIVMSMLKPIFYKNKTKAPIVTPNLYDSTKYEQTFLLALNGFVIYIVDLPSN